MADQERSLAIFLDFENLALGFQGRRERFDIARVLERLVEKGKIVAKKAYADWHRFSHFTHALHEAAIELIEIPRRNQTGKNSADIRLCVDAMDLAYSKEHINTFVILSGDSDFSPLVSKLKELGKHVIGLGVQQSTSELLRDNCDEFIYYEDLGQASNLSPIMDSTLPEAKRKAFNLLIESLMALRRENKEVLWSSMIKDTMKRKKPSFNETYHGYRTFSELLEDACHEGLLELETDKRSRTYVVTRFGNEINHQQPALEGMPAPQPGLEGDQPLPPPIHGNGSGESILLGKRRSRRRRRRGAQIAIPGVTNGGPQIAVPPPPLVIAEAPPRPEPAPMPPPVVQASPPPEQKIEQKIEKQPPHAFDAGLDLDHSPAPVPAPAKKPAIPEKKPAKPRTRKPRATPSNKRSKTSKAETAQEATEPEA